MMGASVIAGAEWITVDAVARRLDISKTKAQTACRRYRLRLAALDHEPTLADRAPRAHELVCRWVGGGRRLQYLVDPAHLDHLFINRGAARGRGRPVGQAAGMFVPLSF